MTVGKRFAVITGANTGIGRVTAVTLASAGVDVLLACRSRERTEPVLAEIAALGAGAGKGSFVALDLSDLEGVRGAVSALGDRPIDLLINNAGLAGARGQTKQGFELAFGVNHLGHFLWTLSLMPQVAAARSGRVIHVASRAHTRVTTLELSRVQQRTSSRSGFPEYCASKLANVLFSHTLAQRLEGSGMVSVSLHPGVVATEIWRGLPGWLNRIVQLGMISPEEGAATTLHCAQSSEVRNGAYYVRSAAAPTSRAGRDEALASALWSQSLTWTGARDWPRG